MARVKIENIGKCGFCNKTQATCLYSKKTWLYSRQRYLCENCANLFWKIDSDLHRRID